MRKTTLVTTFYIFIHISILNASDMMVSQRTFKRMIYSANRWSNLVYKAVTSDVKSNIECADHCQVLHSIRHSNVNNKNVLLSFIAFD